MTVARAAARIDIACPRRAVPLGNLAAGAVELLSQKMSCAVINAGDGAHEHPTQALLDA